MLKTKPKMEVPLSRVLLGSLLVLQLLTQLPTCAQVLKKAKSDNVVAEMQVLCHSDSIVLKVNTDSPFNGMLYAKDAPSSSNCVSEFHSSTNMSFRLPLKACGTLFAEVDDGIEYFNTVVVQPHMRLMTNQGKGYHIRCKYQTRERTIANTHFNVSAAFLMQNGPQASTTPILATASMPSCTMKIFRSGRDDVAETVKIGDKLIMVIEIDQQDMYGMRISSCVVRDGMNMAEQLLINELGCPVDENIMPKFDYSNNFTRAAVAFPAHKFPHTSSVYYQCNVRLCINNNGGCDLIDCAPGNGSSPANQSSGGPRKKRFVGGDHRQVGGQGEGSPGPLPEPSELRGAIRRSNPEEVSFDVYSGLYVNDIDVAESGTGDSNTRQVAPAGQSNLGESFAEQQLHPGPCITLGKCGLLVLLGSSASVALLLLVGFQVGFIGPGERPSPAGPRLAVPQQASPASYLQQYPARRHRDMPHHHRSLGVIS